MQEKPLQKNLQAQKLPIRAEIAKVGDPELPAWKRMQNNRSFLEAAISGDNAKLVRLMKEGVDIDEKNGTMATPLYHAATHGRAETCELLIENGADIAATNAMGDGHETVLHTAARTGHPQVCELVLRKWIETGIIKEMVVVKDSFNQTILHHAAMRGYGKICSIIIKNGADVGAKDKNNETPLHRAADMGHTGTCALLIGNGADMGTKIEGGDYTGMTAAMLAAHHGKAETVHFLESMESLQKSLGKETLTSFVKSFSECVAA